MSEKVQVSGEYSSRFAALATAFADSFRDHGDTGAALSLYYRGELQLDIWAGKRDKKDVDDWQADTRVNVFSAGKALVAVSLLQQMELAGLSLDTPVKEIWPEFQNSQVNVRQVLCHRSGFSAFQKKVPDEVIYDWRRVTEQLAGETPWWEPNQAQGYSPMLFGWLGGELCRRLAGAARFNDVVQKTISQPLGISAGFGLSEEEQQTLADVRALDSRYVPKDAAKLMTIFKDEPGGVTQKAFTNPMSIMVGTNSQAWRQAQIPGGNACTNARSLATFYQALLEPGKLLGEAFTTALRQQQSYSECDNVLKTSLGFGLGFMLSDERDELRLGSAQNSFGHPGAGGCVGFADPNTDIAFAYTTRDMGQSLLLDPRAIRLIDAAYACL
ncbi:serine hydrolase [Pseudoteredinibacter isoporae]|uniref:CubicO group peptidase (Beta-lactamase class C family) n=1 Tax=Pseudoteredinibacter isoporae TaxID=570281 RepID=A0A7X0JV24_9GAMM|nr:CubicO group peptidase (beta-lactamase class C family) [Pseudoteredinibacter isoporae]NHO88334.1 beta-lactamase family protein [Pseudoteredinibacter isoporae]NIB23335.1 beta-lactamase family protein [Pseudoteredinibacter isoporae]